MYLTINKFIQFLDICKILKADIIYVNNNYLYGLDKGNIYLKCIVLDEPIFDTDIGFEFKPCMDFLKVLPITNPLEDKIAIQNGWMVFDNGKITQSLAINAVPLLNMQRIMAIRQILSSLYTTLKTAVATVTDDDITKNENFLECINLKADNGMKLFKYGECYPMSIFTGLLPVNKSDTVKLSIYDFGDTFISKFDILKKKTKSMSVLTRYAKLY